MSNCKNLFDFLISDVQNNKGRGGGTLLLLINVICTLITLMVLQRIKLFFYNNLKLETPSPLNSLYTDDETILVIVDGSTFYQIFLGCKQR